MKIDKVLLIIAFTVCFNTIVSAQTNSTNIHIAPAPLFREHITNGGAADPVVNCKHETLIIMSAARLRISAFPVVH
jgi:hypothetical protein